MPMSSGSKLFLLLFVFIIYIQYLEGKFSDAIVICFAKIHMLSPWTEDMEQMAIVL